MFVWFRHYVDTHICNLQNSDNSIPYVSQTVRMQINNDYCTKKPLTNGWLVSIQE